MKSIKDILLIESKLDINNEYGVEVDVPDGAEVISIMIGSPKGWGEECIFYKLEPLISTFDDNAKAEEVKKALSRIGGTYLNAQGKTKTMLIRFR